MTYARRELKTGINLVALPRQSSRWSPSAFIEFEGRRALRAMAVPVRLC